MKPYYEDGPVTIYEGDCIEVMRELPDASVDAVVTDPPYGLEFMGKGWDRADGFQRSLNADDAGRGNVFGRTSKTSPEYRAGSLFQEWCEVWARECLRVLKPGGHLLAFGATRTGHRLASGIEDAGFEIRDTIAWMYGSGFPKSLDVSKAIDKAAGADREVVGIGTRHGGGVVGAGSSYEMNPAIPNITAPATDAARVWEGWGTALKPAMEPVVVARKPLEKGATVASNVLAHGTGALNIDATRIGGKVETWPASRRQYESSGIQPGGGKGGATHETGDAPGGRWPANVVLDEVAATILDQQSGTSKDGVAVNRNRIDDGSNYNASSYRITKTTREDQGYGGEGGASRFFYNAKADQNERPTVDGIAHPTVKPLALMQWLVRLVTPPNGVVLEPFAGSGTTVEACLREGFDCIAIEREPSYLPLIMQRIEKPHEQTLFA